MSLIPAESYSFPDNYSPVAARRSRVLKDRDAAPRPVNRLESIALPAPIRVEQDFVPPSMPSPETNGHEAAGPSNAEMFLQAFGQIATQSAAPPPIEIERDPVPPSMPLPEANGHEAAGPSNAEMFLQAFGQIAEQNAAPAPVEMKQDLELPSIPAPETNGHDVAGPSDAEMFLRAFGQIAGQTAPPAPIEEEVLPLPPPESLEKANVMPPVSQTAMFFQALGLGGLVNPPANSPAPDETIAEPPRIPFAPRKGRPITPPAVEDISLATANGHGRPRNLRPKTPPHALRYLAAAPVRNVEPKIDNPVFETQPPKPVPPARVMEESFDQFDFEEAAAAPYLRQRRRKKIARFFFLEFMALAVLVPSAGVVLSHELTNGTLVALMNILTIAAAVAAAVIPIMLFAVGPAFTRDRRM